MTESELQELLQEVAHAKKTAETAFLFGPNPAVDNYLRKTISILDGLKAKLEATR